MHDNIVRMLRRKLCDFIIKIQIPFSRTTPPASLCIFDTDPPNGEFIKRIEIFHSLLCEFSCIFFVCEISHTFVFFRELFLKFSDHHLPRIYLCLQRPKMLYFCQNPPRPTLKHLVSKSLTQAPPEPLRHGQRDLSTQAHRHPHRLRPRADFEGVFYCFCLVLDCFMHYHLNYTTTKLF